MRLWLDGPALDVLGRSHPAARASVNRALRRIRDRGVELVPSILEPGIFFASLEGYRFRLSIPRGRENIVVLRIERETGGPP